MNDKISVVIPTYNREKLIKKAVLSVLNQTYQNIEIIIVDDGSKDNTEKVINSIDDNRIKYIKLEKNAGACNARNIGIKNATGKYLTFQDSDDFYHKEKIESQYNNLIKKNSDIDFCKIHVHLGRFDVINPNEEQEKEINKTSVLDAICKSNFISTTSIFIKTELAKKVLFDINMPRMQDYDFLLRAIPNHTISFTNKVLIDTYIQEDSISSNHDKLIKAAGLIINKDYDLNNVQRNDLNNFLINCVSNDIRDIKIREYDKLALQYKKLENMFYDKQKNEKKYNNILKNYELLSKRNDKLNNKLVLLENKNKEINNLNLNLNNENTILKYHINNANTIINQTINSRSWKLTSPLRKINRIVKTIKEIKSNTNDNKESILFFVHAWKDLNNINNSSIGGTTMYLIDIIKNIKNKIHCYVLTVIDNKYMLVEFKDNSETIYDLNVYVKVRNYDLYDYQFYTLVKSIIRNLQIDKIHINHITNFPCDLHLIAKDIYTITSIHDYTLLCPRQFFMNINDEICNKKCLKNCQNCLKKYTELQYNTRNEAAQLLLNNSDEILIPNEALMEDFKKYFKIDNYKVIPHGIDINSFIEFDYNSNKLNQKCINIAFVGSIDGHKGGKTIRDLIINNKNNSITYHLFGVTNYKKFMKNMNNYIYHGPYDKRYIPKLLNDNKIDLVLFLNSCKETFSYTLSEVIYAHIPSLSFDIGAIGNRIKKDDLGWVIPFTKDYKKVENKYKEIFENNEYYKKKNNVINFKNITIENMINNIYNIYKDNYINITKYNYHSYKFLKNYNVIYKKKDED